MRNSRQHGSAENLNAQSTADEPAVGMGATQLHWTERTAYTIVAVRDDGKTIDVQEDLTIPLESEPGYPRYVYRPNPKGDIVTVTKRSGGRWIAAGEPPQDGRRFVIGYRDSYYDPEDQPTR
jgi:hypothetical protein